MAFRPSAPFISFIIVPGLVRLMWKCISTGQSSSIFAILPRSCHGRHLTQFASFAPSISPLQKWCECEPHVRTCISKVHRCRLPFCHSCHHQVHFLDCLSLSLSLFRNVCGTHIRLLCGWYGEHRKILHKRPRWPGAGRRATWRFPVFRFLFKFVVPFVLPGLHFRFFSSLIPEHFAAALPLPDARAWCAQCIRTNEWRLRCCLNRNSTCFPFLCNPNDCICFSLMFAGDFGDLFVLIVNKTRSNGRERKEKKKNFI